MPTTGKRIGTGKAEDLSVQGEKHRPGWMAGGAGGRMEAGENKTISAPAWGRGAVGSRPEASWQY